MARLRRLYLLLVIIFVPLARRSFRQFRCLPHLNKQEKDRLPSLSIIVPARNEAENLVRLLPSLQALRYPGTLEILVVDDESDDATGTIATAYGASVVRLNYLPAGWLGKPHACHRGAEVATGDWLLFTDADTIHSPSGPARVVTYVLAHKLDGLSLFTEQSHLGWLDQLALTAAYAGLFSGVRKATHVLNGQYVLISRAAYRASGGFAAVRAEPLEDLALGHRLRSQGLAVPLVTGDDIARVRMYRDWRQMWQGLTRIGSGSLRWSGLGAWVTALFITGAMTPLLLLLHFAAGAASLRLVVLSWLTVSSGFTPWSRRFGNGWWALLAPFGALVVQVASTWGIINRLLGRRIIWRNRLV